MRTFKRSIAAEGGKISCLQHLYMYTYIYIIIIEEEIKNLKGGYKGGLVGVCGERK